MLLCFRYHIFISQTFFCKGCAWEFVLRHCTVVHGPPQLHKQQTWHSHKVKTPLWSICRSYRFENFGSVQHCELFCVSMKQETLWHWNSQQICDDEAKNNIVAGSNIFASFCKRAVSKNKFNKIATTYKILLQTHSFTYTIQILACTPSLNQLGFDWQPESFVLTIILNFGFSVSKNSLFSHATRYNVIYFSA